MRFAEKCSMQAFLLLLILPVWLGPALAQTGGRLLVGARPAALGEAFVAVADDGNAAYWNPAGLTTLRKQEFNSMWADLFGLDGVKNMYLSYALPLTKRYSVGVDWLHLGFGDDEFSFKQNRYGLSSGYRFFDWFAVGGNLKRFTMETALDGQSILDASGLGFDLGLLIRPLPDLRLGLMAQDVGNTSIEHESGLNETLYSMNLRLGTAYAPGNKLMLAGSLDTGEKIVHLGAEYRIHPAMVLRGGIQRNLEDHIGMIYAFGTGLHYRLTRLDYTYTATPELGGSHRFSLALAFNLLTSAVKIRDPEINALLPVFVHRYYETVGQVKLTNTSNKPMDTTLRLFIPDVMKEHEEWRQSVPPGSTKTVPLKARFDTRFTGATSDRSVAAEIEVFYTRGGRLYGVEQITQVQLYKRNAVQWLDIGVAAAFIQPEHGQVAAFVREALQAQSEDSYGADIWTLTPLRRARQLFDAVGRHGVRFQPDPHTPYGKIAFGDTLIDYIQEPAEVLQTGKGDCDDLTVLYCSLLEHVDIRTALIDAPGHIFMAFDTALSPAQAAAAGLAETTYLVHDGRAWIPVEIQHFGQAFTEAWEMAAEESLRLQNQGGLHILDVREAWRKYPPLTPAQRK